jgi:hypothetical protein
MCLAIIRKAHYKSAIKEGGALKTKKKQIKKKNKKKKKKKRKENQ